MPAERAKGTQVPDDYQPDATTLAWFERRYPQVDVEIAVERFLAWACQMKYANHHKALQNFIIRADDDHKLGPMLKRTPQKQTVSPADRWEQLHKRAAELKFRRALHNESADQYEKAMNESNVTRLRRALP